MKITSEIFGRFWKSYVESIDNLVEYWDNNDEWNFHVLNNQKIEEIIKDDFNGLVAKFEYRKIDIVIYSNETFKNIDYYDNSGEIEDTKIPVGLEVIIEHENDYRKAFEEIKKLTELRSKLKVLITYPEDKKNRVNKSEIALINKFTKGITQADKFLPESYGTEYLLIVGFKEDKNIKWDSHK